ncbi:MAG: class I SAM-dependent methyltransferase [Aeromonadales bacterium]|nr:class I SAM-dependent methyltransferase [Aeromonadales bacterium]MDY2891795.1 class I SAM-dependent methyltransferase [Succinivibrio sp.]
MEESKASVTASICAYIRANADSYGIGFSDPFAKGFLGGDGGRGVRRIIQGAGSGVYELFSDVTIARAAWAEGHLRCFAAGHDRVQYVILGAGFDSFAWRNRNRAIRVFEVDHPDTQRLKLELADSLGIAQISGATFTGVDFSRDSLEEKLLLGGFDPSLPSFFTILGVSWYLPFTAFAQTVRSISGLSQGRARLLFDFQGRNFSSSARGRALSDFTASLGEQMAPGYSLTATEALLFEAGFAASDHLDGAAISRRFTPDRTPSGQIPDGVHFMAAAR